MNKVFFLFFLVSTTFLAFGQETDHESEDHHCYFKKNSVSIGIGPTYSMTLETFGVNSRVYYNVGEKICFGPEFSYFKKNDVSEFDVNFIGHYIFETAWFGLYPLAGVNYSKEENEHHTVDAWGAVFGAGLHRNLRFLTVFMEYAHIESELKNDIVTAGLMLTIK